MKNTGGDEKGKLRAQGDSNSNLGGSAISLKSLHNMEAGGWNGGNNGSSTQHLIPSSEPSSPLDKEMSKSQHWSMSSYIDLHHPELKNRKPSLDAVNTGNGSSSGGGGGAAGREAASGSRSAVINSPRKSSMPASSAIQHANRPGKFSFQKYHRGSTKASQQTLEPPSLTVTAAARHHSSASNLVSAPSLNRLWKQKSANTIAIDSDFLSLGDDNVHDDDDPAAKKPRKPSSTSSDDINNNNKKRKISDSGTAMGKFLQKRGANPFKAVLPVIKTNSSRISIEEPVMPQNGIIPPPAPRRLNPILMPYVKPPSYEKYNSGRHVAEIEQQVRYRKRIKASLNTKLAPLLQQKTRLFFARRKINFVYDRKYRDVWAAALFVITFGIFLFLAYHGIVESGKILGGK